VTSVKDFRVEEPATATELGRGAFVFSDDYSVFDWGRMPDRIPRKGASLCAMGAFNFERLQEEGVTTHYRGVVAGGDAPGPETTAGGGASDPETTAGEADSEATTGVSDRDVTDLGSAIGAGDPPREMAIDLTQVPDLPFEGGTYDYDAYHEAGGNNYLVPLEIVFRNTVPVGSSLRSRTAPDEHGLDVDAWPDEPVDLPEPVVEFSTKYEKQDRYLDREEADRIAGRADLGDLESLARTVNRVVTDRAREAGLVHQDGKIECLYHRGEARVADVVGTFDENRFSHGGQQVSKEVIRQYYRREHPGWVGAVSDAKERARKQNVADWRGLCERDPPALPDRVIEAASDLYAAGANAYTDSSLFDAPPLPDAVEAVRRL